jgi:hypothetical protein
MGSYPIMPSVTGSNLTIYTVDIVNGTLTVTAAPTKTTLTTPGNAAYLASETLTATVVSAEGTPGGIVTFYNGSTALGNGTLNSSGVATLTTTLPMGTDTVTATYATAGNFAASSSTPVTLTITAPPARPVGSYTVAANPSTLTVAAGGTATTTLTFTPTGGYTGTIALSCSNLPTNASCAFAQNQVALSGDNQRVNLGLTISATTQQGGKHALQSPLSPPTLFALVFGWPGGLTGLAVLLRRRTLVQTRHPWHRCLLLVSTCALAAGLSSCGTSGSVNGVVSTITSQVTVVATGTSGTVFSTQTVALTLNMTQ